MGRNKNNNKQTRLKKQNEKLMTALTSTAASTQASVAAAATTTTTTTTTGDANEKDNGMAKTTTTPACYHGSDEGNFAKASDYQILVFDEWISVLEKQGTAEYLILFQNFVTKNEDLLQDSDFYRYTFAYTTEMFRKTYKTEKYSPSFKLKLKQILNLAIDSKYWYSPLLPDIEKREKYYRDVATDRGIINVLHRETTPFCHCMQSLKSEAKKMEKLGICYGCNQEFPKEKLKRCIRCDCVQYCSKECQKKNWPRHKKDCKKNNNKTSIKAEE